MYLSFSIERGGYELKRIIAASLEASLKDLQQVESSLADNRAYVGQSVRPWMYIHLYVWSVKILAWVDSPRMDV